MAGPVAPQHEPETTLDVERLVFFSDAVIAIAITLLVIDLRVPETLGSDAALRDALVQLLPSLLSFFLSFGVIALWWMGHHRLLRDVERAPGSMVGLNFVLLGSIAFLPFASGVLGHHGDLPTAVILYAGTNIVAASALLVMRIVAQRRGLLRDDVDPGAFRRRTRFAAVTVAIFAASIPVALASTDLARLLWDLVFVQVAYRSWDERRRRRLATETAAEA
jgi:uncharacterized membrane protein